VNKSPNIYYDIPMYCESNNTTLNFKNLCALIKITLSIPEGTSDTAFSQIIAQTDEKALYGEAKIEDVIYPKLKVWVTNDGLIRKKEDYSLSGQLLRTTLIPKYQIIGQRSIPYNMIIVDNLKGKKIDDKMQYEKTTITINNVSFAVQKDSVFTKAYLEMMNN